MNVIYRVKNRFSHKGGGSRDRKSGILMEAQKAIYIPIPKVACSSVMGAIAELQGVEVEWPNRQGSPRIHDAKFVYVNAKDTRYDRKYWRFCVVRNPWDRLVSCFKEKIKESPDVLDRTGSFENGVHRGFLRYGLFEAGMSFERFVEAVLKVPDKEADRHLRSQYTFISNRDGKYIADYVARFENLYADFGYIAARLGEAGFELPHLNKTRSSSYGDYYTDGLVEKVGHRYKEDVRLFHYVF